MTLWVDGIALAKVGVVGNSYENMSAGTNYFTVYFTAGGAPTEIIIQRSSFVLYHGGRLNPIYLCEQHLITSMHTLSHLRVSVILGITLMAALLYLGIFLFFKTRMWHLWFALVCLMIALRTIGIDNRMIATLLPGLDWRLDYLIAYLITSGFIVFIVLYLDAMFERKTNRKLLLGGIGILVAHAAFMLATPPLVYSRFNTQYNIFLVLFTGAIVGNIAWLVYRHREMRRIEHILILFACAANVALGFGEAALRAATPQAAVNYTQIGTMIFTFINTIALAIHFRHTEEAAESAKRKEQEERAAKEKAQQSEQRLADENAALESLNRMRIEYLANVSHETKTPLTLISVDVQLAAELHKEEGEDGKLIADALRRAQEEILRAARITENNLRLASMQESREKMRVLDFSALLISSVEARRGIIKKGGNTLLVDVPDTLPNVNGNSDQLIQVMSNLLNNAAKHTTNGEITVAAKPDAGSISVTVSDTGTGIDKAMLARVFERGVTGSGGTGIGLSISKNIIEAHGGDIWLESEKGKGTALTFTLPI
jgi:signal transduction histidine kinase